MLSILSITLGGLLLIGHAKADDNDADIRGLWKHATSGSRDFGVSHFYSDRVVYSYINHDDRIISHTAMASYEWLPLDRVLKCVNKITSKSIAHKRGNRDRWKIAWISNDSFLQKTKEGRFHAQYVRIPTIRPLTDPEIVGFSTKESPVDGVWITTVGEGWFSMLVLDRGRICETHYSQKWSEATGQLLGVYTIDDQSKTLTEYISYTTKNWHKINGVTRSYSLSEIADGQFTAVRKDDGKKVIWKRPAP